MLEFLKNYWPLLVCVLLIIVAIVLLICFRDKKETTEIKDETKDNQAEEQPTKEEPAKEEVKQEPAKKEIKEEKVKEPVKAKKVVKEKTEEPVEAKKPKATKVKKEEVKQEPAKEEIKEEPEAEEKKERAQKYMVTYDKEQKDWVVKKTGASRASKRCKTKKEAMEVAERLAESQDLNLTVKKKDGKFQKRENASR